MLRLRDTKHVRIAKAGNAADILRDPDVLGIVLPHVWSQRSLDFAEDLTRRPELNVPGTTNWDFGNCRNMKEWADRTFMHDHVALFRLFRAVRTDLIGRSWLGDFSRIEPARGDAVTTDAGKLHVDNEQLVCLTVPGGVTSRIVRRMLNGSFNRTNEFTPKNPEADERAAQSMPNHAALIMKGAYFPPPKVAHELLHGRDDKLAALANRARVVVQFTAS